MSNQSELRTQLKRIRDDASMTPSEKSRKSQELMMQKVVQHDPSNGTLHDNCSKTCNHYEKNCSNFYFACCNVVDPCHRCHMARECCETKPPAITSIKCNSCDLKQEPGPTCTCCLEPFSHSFCMKCKIWTSADIHHCEGCGFCRVGKAEDIFHCDNCDACFSASTREHHVCAKTKLKGELCPLCLESGMELQIFVFFFNVYAYSYSLCVFF